MRKVKLMVTETLKYEREIIVEVPDDVCETKLEGLLDVADRAGYADGVDGFVRALERRGVQNPDGYDTDLSSPSSYEAECDDYEFLDDRPEEDGNEV